MFGGHEHTLQVDVKHPVPVGHRQILRTTQPSDTGVVDQNVQLAEVRGTFLDKTSHVSLFADVCFDEETFAAEFLDLSNRGRDGVSFKQLPSLGLFLKIGDHDPGAFPS